MDINQAFELIVDKLSVWVQEFILLLPNIALAAVIMVFGIMISKFIRKYIRKIFKKVFHNEALINLFTSLVYVFLLGVTLFVALSVLQLDKAVTSILAGAGIIGLALAFAFQDIAANVMSGIVISIRRPLRIGDIVKVKDHMGVIVEINLRDSVIKTFQGQMVIIPNKDLLQNPIENYSLMGKRRIDLTVGVSYGEDLERVRDITLKAVADIEGTTDDEITFFYQEFGDSSINFDIRIWVNTAEQVEFLQVKSDAVMRIKKAFDLNNITIPFPIRTLDFGIKGGQPLSEALMNNHVRSSLK